MRTHFRVIALSRFCKSPEFAWQVLFLTALFLLCPLPAQDLYKLLTFSLIFKVGM